MPLAKPYNNKILLARIMANIRRVQMDGAEPSVNGYHCAAFTPVSYTHLSSSRTAARFKNRFDESADFLRKLKWLALFLDLLSK